MDDELSHMPQQSQLHMPENEVHSWEYLNRENELP